MENPKKRSLWSCMQHALHDACLDDSFMNNVFAEVTCGITRRSCYACEHGMAQVACTSHELVTMPCHMLV